MAEQSKDILSEYTKDITPEQRAELQEKVSNMTEEELKELYLSSAKDASSIEKNEETLISWEDYRKK